MLKGSVYTLLMYHSDVDLQVIFNAHSTQWDVTLMELHHCNIRGKKAVQKPNLKLLMIIHRLHCHDLYWQGSS